MEMLETQTMGKVARRLIPYLMFCYFFPVYALFSASFLD